MRNGVGNNLLKFNMIRGLPQFMFICKWTAQHFRRSRREFWMCKWINYVLH